MKTFNEFLNEENSKFSVGDKVKLTDDTLRAKTTKIMHLNKNSVGVIKSLEKGTITSPHFYKIQFDGDNDTVELPQSDIVKV